MMQPVRPITDDELHAYIDGALDPARCLAVATYLAAHPPEAARTEAFRAQREGIRALFDHVLDQPVPEQLREVMFHHGARATWRRFAWALVGASLVLVLALGGRALHDHLPAMHDAQILPQPSVGPNLPVVRPPLPPVGHARNAQI